MKVIVCGGRNFSDRDALWVAMGKVHACRPLDLVIVGGSKGADSLAEEWADAMGIHCAVVCANWNVYGKSAGPKRNRAMLLMGPDGLVAFPGGAGTADMVRAAEAAGVKVWKPLS